jgi:hypothetical protein
VTLVSPSVLSVAAGPPAPNAESRPLQLRRCSLGLDFGGLDFGGLDFGGLDFGGLDFGGLSFGGLSFGGLVFRFQEKQKPAATRVSCGRLTPPHQPPQPSFFPYPLEGAGEEGGSAPTLSTLQGT